MVADDLRAWRPHGPGAHFRSLPDEWRRLARLVDLINLFDFLGRPDPTGVIARDVLPLVEAIVREYG